MLNDFKGLSFIIFDKKIFICWVWKVLFRRVFLEIRLVVWGIREMFFIESRDIVVGDILVDLCVKFLSMYWFFYLYCFNLSNLGNRSFIFFI